MHRFYAPPSAFKESTVWLTVGETRHLSDVLRLRVGDEANVFDGEGSEYYCRISKIGKDEVSLITLNKIGPSAPESPLVLHVAAAITPPDKFDLVVQKCVELGVHRFTPLVTSRCEVRVKDGSKKLERWRRIAFEAAKQCGRARLMAVEEIADFRPFIDAERDQIIMFSERDGKSFDEIPRLTTFTAIYGPKGGWEDSELEAAQAVGATIITFGGRILRAETAGIALTAILQHRFGDMN